MAWSSWQDATWKVIYAEAFRAPSAYELHYADPQSEVPASDLGPETTRTVEGSFEQRLGPHRLMFGALRSWWIATLNLAGSVAFGVSAAAAYVVPDSGEPVNVQLVSSADEELL